MAGKNLTCCICGHEYNGHGNDPHPLDKTPGARCCDYCYEKKVIVARYMEQCKHKKMWYC